MSDTDSNDDILSSLNPQQRQAAAHGDSPLLIIAGAGTGKTQTLVHRVAHLIDRGAEPSRILLLTFTRRASGEMLRRPMAFTGTSGVVRFDRDAGAVLDDIIACGLPEADPLTITVVGDHLIAANRLLPKKGSGTRHLGDF